MPDTTIRHTIVLPAAHQRVWLALCDSSRFGTWFGADFDAPFVAGQPALGRIAPTRVDPAIARLQEPFAGNPLALSIDTIDPMHKFAFRWHPFPVGPAAPAADEPMTQVTFTLAQADDGIELTVTETGFEALPPARREPAFNANNGGWAHQMQLIARYLSGDFDR